MSLRFFGASALAQGLLGTRKPVRDDAWFEGVYRAHLGYVLHTLRRLGVDERDRPDLAQDVFVVVHRHREAYDDARPLRPWLFGIAFRIARRAADKHSKRFEVLTDFFDDVTEDRAPRSTGAPDDLVEHARRKARMRDALAQLEPDKRLAFLLCDVEELTVPAAAALVGENVNTFGSRLRAARTALRNALTEQAPAARAPVSEDAA